MQFILESTSRKKGVEFAKLLQVHQWRTSGVNKQLQLVNGSKLALYEYLNQELGQPSGFNTDQADAIGMALYWRTKYFSKVPFDKEHAQQFLIKGETINDS
ncbi:hypothetical protein [Fontibacillus phaseoli]|uniref:hypothetical protein n=1 Tax=Fontibacillus phaseoli TaxID=1416533 RepID=UPI0011C01FDA|nr:hypothetical protein [Fontibacillus phaseoli]